MGALCHALLGKWESDFESLLLAATDVAESLSTTPVSKRRRTNKTEENNDTATEEGLFDWYYATFHIDKSLRMDASQRGESLWIANALRNALIDEKESETHAIGRTGEVWPLCAAHPTTAVTLSSPSPLDSLRFVESVSLSPSLIDRLSLSVDSPPSSSLSPSEYIHALGRWGEMWMYQYLRLIHGDGRVQWMNERRDSLLPYDMVISADSMNIYVEVKCSGSKKGRDERRIIHVTSNELAFARQEGERYHVYIVTPPSPLSPPRLVWIKNTDLAIRNREVDLCLRLPS